MSYAVVIPTTGRPSLRVLLEALATAAGPAPERIVVADDRPAPAPLPGHPTEPPGGPLPLPAGVEVRVLRTGGRGPAAARNAGWRAVDTEWVAFLDDDVVPGPRWPAELAADLAGLGQRTGGSQGRIEVPLPAGRRPTDAERGTAGLAGARWITADMAYRRAVLEQVGGFDERFPRAYREDADLALRVIGAGHQVAWGRRRSTHPVRPAGFLASVRAQAGNADDVLMRRKHGRGWRTRIGGDRGRIGWHAVTTASAATAVLAGLARLAGLGAGAGTPPGARASLPRALGPAGVAATAGALVWAALTTEFALRRILPGPRTPAELARMIVTSVFIPPVACGRRLAGELRWGRKLPAGSTRRPRPPFAANVTFGPSNEPNVTFAALAVLFDRDDTLVEDVPYNGDPGRVRPVPGAREALDRLRRLGVPVGVVSNQSGVARGLISIEELDEVNARVEQLLGPFAAWQICVHREDDGCDCRKPRPGLVQRAAAQLGVPVTRCVVIGDTGADVDAAAAAGARGILVPTWRTRPEEITAAAEVAPDITTAVEQALDSRYRSARRQRPCRAGAGAIRTCRRPP